MTSICLLGIVLASSPAWAQGAPEQKPLLSEQAFKNVQLLRGIPVDEFMQTMGFISASTGMNCIDCHTQESGGDWTKYADDTALKQTTRRMILMVRAINQANFAGKREVTCWSCHRGGDRPQVIPRLAVQYTYVEEVPDEILQQAPRVPSADQILDKYIQALGGAQSVAALTSFAGKGTYEGYDTGHDEVPVEVFGKAPGQRATIIHTRDGDSTLA
ncbi:MAG TPA: photosynthetic reaction center cytochrome c subunit family protein, partial [Candidatus Angelobacter sp.]|nr:photosynthetic reaction center cytochrome c subunit family protein [Candidatus Angelobacter sp.]